MSDLNWQRWDMGRLDRRNPDRTRTQPPASTNDRGQADTSSEATPTRRREDQISITMFELAKEEAKQKGYEQGHSEGLEQGRAEGIEQVREENKQEQAEALAAAVAPIEQLATQFRKAIENLHENVSSALVELALETGQQLAGRALEIKPEHILDDVEALLEANPTITGTPTLFVNIDDYPLVQTQLGEMLEAISWHLRADSNLERGDCRVETDEREIDATMADRWTRLLHAVGHEQH